MSRIAEFERENQDVLEKMKERLMNAILGITAVAALVSGADGISLNVVLNYGIVALGGYVLVNAIWFLEQRHDLTSPSSDS